MSDLLMHQLGLTNYQDTFSAMQKFTRERLGADGPDQIWLTEHEPVFTMGAAASQSDILNAEQIPVVQTDRGGKVTYHGPGQAIVYLMLNLRLRKIKVRQFVEALQNTVIKTLAEYAVIAFAKSDAPGVYIAAGVHQGAKIASLGLKILSNGCCYHGVAINVAMDLKPFSQINPCGVASLPVVDLQSLGVKCDLPNVQAHFVKHLKTFL